MRWSWVSGWIVMCSAAALTAVAQAPLAGEPKLPAPVFSRQAMFAIPFHIERAATPAQEPVGVELHVSQDGGETWRLYSKTEPTRAGFIFRAPQDGEFWFLVRTVDRQGERRPRELRDPELRVIVDTIPPVLELKAARAAGGEVRAEWRIEDGFPRMETFRLEYKVLGSAEAWRPIAVDLAAQQTANGQTLGQATWVPEGDAAGTLLVRAEVIDQAGNRTVTPYQVRTGEGGAASPGSVLPQAAPESGRTATGELPPRSGLARSGAWPVDQASEVPLGSPLVGVEEVPVPPGQRRRVRHTPASNSSATGGAAELPPAEEIALPPGTPSTGAAPSGGNYHVMLDPTGEVAHDAESRGAPPGGAEGAASADIESRRRLFDVSQVPRGQMPALVNSLRFELDYSVESVGSSGVGKVELWGTRDGGRSWHSYGIDEDRQSPLLAELQEEGIFGFRIAVQSGTGFGGQAPASGEPPDVWVAVDVVKPYARILAIEPGQQDRAGQLEIRWQADDETLAAYPITLAYSPQPEGPWTAIVTDFENAGEYVWRLDHQVPEQFFLRLEVRDAAGNVAVVETREPVTLDRAKPQGRILQVRPRAG